MSTGTEIVILTPKQQRFVHLYITGQYTLKKLGEVLDVSPLTLGKWLKVPEIRSSIESYQLQEHEFVELRLKSLRTEALGKLGELVNSPVDAVALQAVKDVLDRTGHKPQSVTKKDVNITVQTFEKQLSTIIDETLTEDDFIDVELQES